MSELKRLQRIFDRARSATERHRALEDIAEHFLNHGDYEEALHYYEMELQAAIQLQSDEKIAKAHRMIGEAQVQLAEYDKALQHTQKYYDWACADDSRLVEQQRALTTLGRTNLIKADSMKDRGAHECKKAYSLAEKSLWMSLRLCEKLDPMLPSVEVNDMRARSLLNLGLTYEGTGKSDEATKQYDVAIRLCRKHKIDSTLRHCCLSYASLLIRQKAFENAFKLYGEAFATLKNIPNASTRSRQGADILFAESEGHLWKGDVHSARRALQKAYKMLRKCSIHENFTHVTERLKLVAAMDLLQRKLSVLSLPPEQMSKQYEELGDGFSSFGMFSFALTNYEKMLEYGKIADINLKACYVSLAQTCKDLKDYKNAIKYFELELAYCTAPEDIYHTLLSIQECQGLLKLPEQQLETLLKAADVVEKLKKTKLKKKILEEVHKVQLMLQSEDAEKTLQDLNSLCELSSDSEEENDEDSPQEQTPNIGDYIDLDALTDDSEDEEEDSTMETTFTTVAPKSKRPPARRKSASLWRNEKGETKLHVACMNGNIKAVRTVLEQGCDIHATDYAGWTAFHEACNYGHIDVIELLLEYGADINSKGGPENDITPLYDAGQAGNFEVMEFLLDHNASVAVLTEKGETALDALNAYYERARAQNSLSGEQIQQYICVRDRLKSCLNKVDMPMKEAKTSNVVQHQSDQLSKGPSPRGAAGKLRRLIDDDMDLDSSICREKPMRDISPVSSPVNVSSCESDADEGQEGVSEYINAIQGVRKKTEASSSGKPKRRKKPLEPLLNENEVGDNWLEDDIGKQPNKKRKSNPSTSAHSTHNSSYKPLSLKKKSSSRVSLNSCSSRLSSASAQSVDTREDQRWSTGSVNSDTLEMDINLRNFEDDDFHMRNEDSHNLLEDSWENNSHQAEAHRDTSPLILNKTNQSSLLMYGVTRTFQNSQVASSQLGHPVTPTPSCVNVKIEDHRLAIFIQDPSLSIGWLAKEAARRYKKLQGCSPTLSIYSLDGALYSDEDPVQVVLGSDVVGCVDSWNDSCISDRYKEACEVSSTDKKDDILSLLEESQATHSLDIRNTVYPAQIFKPVFRVISLERNLASLNLSTNLLQDKGVADLCASLAKLCSLKELDLSGNNVSAVGVGELAKAAKKNFLKVLQRLNLSHNNLGDACLPHLVDITASVSQLQHLLLADCMFTKAVGDKCDEFLTLNHLETLDLSNNQLFTKGLARFLGFGDHNEDRRLNPERLRNLHLLGLEGDRLCQELILFFEQGNSIALRTLHLSFCTMKDDELAHLLSFLKSAPELHTIRILSAKNVKSKTVCQLLVQQPHLRHLEIHNMKAIWKNELDDIVTSITHAANYALETLILRDLPESARIAWQSVKGPAATIRQFASGLQVLSSSRT